MISHTPEREGERERESVNDNEAGMFSERTQIIMLAASFSQANTYSREAHAKGRELVNPSHHFPPHICAFLPSSIHSQEIITIDQSTRLCLFSYIPVVPCGVIPDTIFLCFVLRLSVSKRREHDEEKDEKTLAYA